jgi:hypothetical protein
MEVRIFSQVSEGLRILIPIDTPNLLYSRFRARMESGYSFDYLLLCNRNAMLDSKRNGLLNHTFLSTPP